MSHAFRKFSRNEILSAIGLQTRRSAASTVLPVIGMFGVGIMVGAGLGLLFAPKTGRQTRDVIGSGISDMARRVRAKVRGARDEMSDADFGDDYEAFPRNDASPTGTMAGQSRNGSGSSMGTGVTVPKI